MKKKICGIFLCMLLIVTVLLPAVLSIKEEIMHNDSKNLTINSINFKGRVYATLCTHEGPSITGSQLRRMIDNEIPTQDANSTIIVFTQCYGGDMMSNFQGRDDTTTLSATSMCQRAYYGGYDDNASRALKPEEGRTTDDVHDAGVDGRHPRETPRQQGSENSLEPTSENGEIKSRHVLVYAGQPDSDPGRDHDQRDTIVNNFAGQHQTTVTTVGGNGTDGWDHPGTLEGLREALEGIGENMNNNEQFILFVTDHGDKHAYIDADIPEYGDYYVEIPDAMMDDMLYDVNNQPDCTIITNDSIEIPFNYISVNNHQYIDFVEYPIDINGDGMEDFYEYVFPIDEEILISGENNIVISTLLGYPQKARISLGSGDMPKLKAPNNPIINGETNGNTETEYIYQISSVDPEEDNVWYYVDWGDAEITNWDGPYASSEVIEFNHIWDEKGDYTIKVKAMDIFESESGWGELEVTMPRNKVFGGFFQRFLINHPNLFPILQQLLLRLGLQ